MRIFSMAVLGCALLAGSLALADDAASTIWHFDNLTSIGGAPTHVEGHPQLIDTPAGKAIRFDGVADALFIDKHPLAGAKTFTFEAIFRPDGGAFAQRWFHLAEIDPATGKDSDARFLFELRAPPGTGQWYLDAFANGPGYKATLAVADKLHPLGQWYAVEQTYDGKTYRSYVNGVLQGQADIAFVPQGSGHASVGVRMTRVNYFNGAVLEARFTPRALTPEEFLKLPSSLDKP